MNSQDIAHSKYIEFSNYEGSQHIAGEFAILKILDLVKIFKVQSVLEIGLGIGTLPSAVLQANSSNMTYVGTEDNRFCLDSLAKNLKKEIRDTLHIHKDISQVIQEHYLFDLIIIDGYSKDLKALRKSLSAHAIICIEGDRVEQENSIRAIFPTAKYVHLISMEKNNPSGIFNSEHWQGGLKVFFINPTFKQLAYYSQMKLRTKLNYIKRQKHKNV